MTDRSGLPVSVPVRTCVGGRRRDSWSALLRVVAETDDTGAIRLTPDLRHRLPGRGAWLHPTGDCLDQALRRRAFGRALRLDAACDPAAVAAYIESVATGHEQNTSPEEPSVSMGTESGFDADEHPMSTQQ